MKREDPKIEIGHLRDRTEERLRTAKVLLREASAQFRRGGAAKLHSGGHLTSSLVPVVFIISFSAS